ncbi:hypothetical protein [Nannocystis sp.]|uniref:hypothetical protein n=1 Tax=Nannocystis sp. TaxID=1962667 RepID=UPI0025EB631D|nr:hypothetical protein [Nannocystis sp.]MBK7824325.1 hypothetical protein [Nannocystis sp.]
MALATCPYRHVARISAVALGALWPALAGASNPWLTPLGSEAAMSGGAVAAMGRDTGMAYYNPAGLGANTRVQFNMSSTMAVLRFRTIPNAFRVDLPGGDSQSAQLSNVQPLILSTSTVYARHIGRGVTIGAGHFASNYDFYDYTGVLKDDHNQSGLNYRARVQVDGWSTRHHFGPTVGWQITPRLRLGMSLFLTYEWRRDEGRIWLQAGPSPQQISQNFIVGDIDLKRSTYAGEAVFGLQWEFARRWTVALVVRTPRIAAYERARKYSLTTGAIVRADKGTAALFDYNDDPGAARRGRIAPMQVVLGLGYAFSRGRGWISAEADYTPALRLPHNSVDLRHNVNARLGARLRLNEAVVVGLGLFTDRTNETAISDFPQFHIDYYGGSGGAELRRPFTLGKTERAKDIVFVTGVAFRYAFGTGASGAVRFDLSEADKQRLSYSIGEVHPVQFHVWSGHLGAGLYF